jgi:hypothetical protein
VFERKEDAQAFLEGSDRKVRRISPAVASAA